jgi:hypothetical protein
MWTTISIPATLTAGTNLIRATAIGSSGPNLDHLVISNTAQASTIASNEDAFDRRGRCSFKVYPNPAKQELSIAPDIEDKESFEVTLIDIYGRAVKTIAEKNGDATITLTVDNVPDGVYQVRVVQGKRTGFETVIIKK